MTAKVVQATLHRHAGRFTFAFFATNTPYDIPQLSVLRRRLANNGDRGFGELKFELYEDPAQPRTQRFGIFPQQERIRPQNFERLLRTRVFQDATLSTSWVDLADLRSPFFQVATAKLIALRAAGA
jgi:hypothetical protein